MYSFKALFLNTFLQKIRGKMFIFSTLFLMLAATLLILWPKISAGFSEEEVLKIGVIDQSDYNLAELLSSNEEITYKKISNNEVSAAEKDLESEKLGALITLKSGSDYNIYTEIKSKGSLGTSIIGSINESLNGLNYTYAIQKLGIKNEEGSNLLNAKPVIKQVNIEKTSILKSESDVEIGSYLAYGVGFLIYLFILSYLSMITTDIANEKGSKIMEVLVSAVSPQIHLLSKVLGLLSVAILQLTLFIGYTVGLAYTVGGKSWTNFSNIIDVVSSKYIIFTLTFILLSYVLYLLIGAFLGSFVTKVEETSQAILPAMAVVMFGFFVMFYGIANPTSLIVKICSYIPFTSPLVMPLRISTTNIAMWEILLSLLILVGTIIGTFVLTTRLYRGAVLVYNSNSFINKYKKAWTLGER